MFNNYIYNNLPTNIQSLYSHSYYIETLKNPTCFDPCGIIITDYVHQMILYKTLTHSLMIIPHGSKNVGVLMF